MSHHYHLHHHQHQIIQPQQDSQNPQYNPSPPQSQPQPQPQHGPPDFPYPYAQTYPNQHFDHPEQAYYHPQTATSAPNEAPPVHLYPPPFPLPTDNHIRPPPLSLNLPDTLPQFNPAYPIGFQDPNQPLLSPYTPLAHPQAQTQNIDPTSVGSQSQSMNEYFPPFTSPPDEQYQQHQPAQQIYTQAPLISPTWQSTPPVGGTARPQPLASGSGTGKRGGHNAKTSRQQFTACGACRHRRVKCDLKERQDAAEKNGSLISPDEGIGAHRSSSATRRDKVTCTNCAERGTNCIDEFAPLKIVKQLRRGKRISEIEMRYGRTAINSALTVKSERTSESSNSPPNQESSKGKADGVCSLPELTRDFFDSPFFRRFQVQRPILDPTEFVQRFFSHTPPSAAAMGQEGAILCHVLYAWAVSYGVDEHGQLDVVEGGGVPVGPVDLNAPGPSEYQRENDRQKRKDRMSSVVQVVLREIDECGVLRKPTWDGVRCLLLTLPLTEGIASQVERLAMYEAAVSQVYTLCSFGGLGYDGLPSGTSGVNGGTDAKGTQNYQLVRVRIYWYAFVHEGITTGLKGGRLHLDDEDLETIQDSINSRAIILKSNVVSTTMKLATAPIHLALACRLINKALTGPSAKRRQKVDGDALNEAWEALEGCWEEFESLRLYSPPPQIGGVDEIIRFADGWKIFLFEAQNVIRTNLEERIQKIQSASSNAYITDHNPALYETKQVGDLIHLQHLLDISRAKCEMKTRQILEIVRHHVGTRFFEWDASLVRDGTYYTAMLLAKEGAPDEDIAVCLQALNELRWAHAKAWERSADLRREWAENRALNPVDQVINSWVPNLPLHIPPQPIPIPPAHSQSSAIPPTPLNVEYVNPAELSSTRSNSPFTSPDIISPTYDPSTARYLDQTPVHPHSRGDGKVGTWPTQPITPLYAQTGMGMGMGYPSMGMAEVGQHQHAYTTSTSYTQGISRMEGALISGPELSGIGVGVHSQGYVVEQVQEQAAGVGGEGLRGNYIMRQDGTQVFIPFSG